MERKGFTLIELLVVISIIGLLSSIVFASLSTSRAKGRDAKRRTELNQLQTALNLYYDINGVYPEGRYFSAWNSVTWENGRSAVFYDALVGGGFISKLPVDPVNGESGIGNYLGDNTPTDQAYVYHSSYGLDYTLGTNLEQGGGVAHELGNYQLTGN